MAGLRPHLEHGPETHLAGENIVGGTLVQPGSGGTAGKVVKTTVDSTTVLGLAIGDAAGTAGAVAATQDAWGRYSSGGLTPPNEVAVAYRGSWWVKNSDAAAWSYGQALYAGANGILQRATTTGRVVAFCIEPGGVAQNAEGRVRLQLG